MDTGQGKPGQGTHDGHAHDFEALTRQYWNAWGEVLRGAAPEAGQAGLEAWYAAVDWWTRLAHDGRGDVDAMLDRFNSQARSWYGLMQQVAARFAGQEASAADIAQAWKRALGAAGENPFPELFRAMRGQGQQGLDQWIEDASPFLEAWKREGAAWLGMPAFGFAREHQERWQRLAQAQLDYQQQASAYNALLSKVAQRAFGIFEDKLAARAEPGMQLRSARALFDLWIDAAEEAYAEIALSPEFRQVYGALVDAQMRVRGGVQRQVEEFSGALGMPTRSEVDAAHRKIAQLEREVRRLRDAVATASRPAPPAAGSETPGREARRASGARRRDAGLKVQGDPLTPPGRKRGDAATRAGERPLKAHGDPLAPARKPAPKPKPARPAKGKR